MICFNGGKWNGKACECPSGFAGDQCQQVVGTCWNGGVWDGIKCLCPELYQGPKCEEVVPSIELPDTVSAQVELTVTVTSVNFSEELEDPVSEKYQNFAKEFTRQMDLVYSGIPEYEGVNITRLSRGSVVVDHEVLLKAKYTPQYNEVFKNVSQKVEQKIINVTTQQISVNNVCKSILCFNTSATKVQNVTVPEFKPEEECRRKVGQDLAHHFFVEYVDGKLHCITRCMSGFNNSLNCLNGKCQLREGGARCYCLTTDTEWYSGETCESSTKKSLVYGLVGAACSLVLIIFTALLVFLFRSRREAERQKSKVTQLYKWHEEDGGSAPGTFQNVGFDICEEQDDALQLDSIYSNFQPSLDHIDSETKIKIQRPQVMMTSI
nr:mucin-17 [Manis javanica]